MAAMIEPSRPSTNEACQGQRFPVMMATVEMAMPMCIKVAAMVSLWC